MSEHDAWPVFKQGDLCTCEYDERGSGLLYRVNEVDGDMVKIQPVLGLLTTTRYRKTRTLHRGWCKHWTLAEVAAVVQQIDHFVGIESVSDVTKPWADA